MTNIPTNEEEAKKLIHRGDIIIVIGMVCILTGVAAIVGIILIVVGLQQKTAGEKFLGLNSPNVKGGVEKAVDNISDGINNIVDNVIKGRAETMQRCEYCGSKFKSSQPRCPNCGGTAA